MSEEINTYGEPLEEIEDGYVATTIPPFEIPFEWYDAEKFHEGIKDYSYVAGAVTALFNVGASEDFILNYLLNEHTAKHNTEITKLNNETSVEVAKQQRLVQERHEL